MRTRSGEAHVDRNGGKGGVIVNVSTGFVKSGAPGMFVDYAASKGAIETFTGGLAREVASEGSA